MILTILGNLGRDTTLSYTQNGKAVCNLAMAYTVGFGQNEKTQWIDCVLWGDRAVKLQPMLVKGKKLVVYADDLVLETYQKNAGGEGSKLKCRVINIEFAGGRQEGGQEAPQQDAPAHHQAAPSQNQAAPAQGQPAGFDNFDDDIGF